MYSSLTMSLGAVSDAEPVILRPSPRDVFTDAQFSEAAQVGYTLMYLETSCFVSELLDEYPPEFFAGSLSVYRDAGFMRSRRADSWYLVRVAQEPGPLIGGLAARLLDAHETIHVCLSHRISAVRPLLGGELLTDSVYVSSVQSPTHFNFPRISIDDAAEGIGIRLVHEQERRSKSLGLYGIRALSRP